MQSLNLIAIIDGMMFYGIVRGGWWVIKWAYRIGHKNYEGRRDRDEAIRRHYIEAHNTDIRSCDYNECATIL